MQRGHEHRGGIQHALPQIRTVYKVLMDGKAVEYLKQLIEDESGNPKLSFDLALAHFQLAERMFPPLWKWRKKHLPYYLPKNRRSTLQRERRNQPRTKLWYSQAAPRATGYRRGLTSGQFFH